MSNYGIPYMGSKDKIIASIAMMVPSATHFYDLFGGGFSVSHYMIEQKNNRYKYFHYNEIKSDVVELVKQSINGDFNQDKFKPDWISREKFIRLKDNDPYIRCIWSFGNNQKQYIFGLNIEAYKRSMHMAVVFDEFDALATEVFQFSKFPGCVKTIKQRRYFLRQLIEHYRKTKIPKILHQFIDLKRLDQLERLQQLEQLPQLNQLERLQRLEQLEQLERLQQLPQLDQLERLQQLPQLDQLERLQQLACTSVDYRQVEILPHSVVYCDIPYQGTAGYGEFNHKEFFDWAATREFPVYISEYNISDPRFKLIYTIDKRSLLSSEKMSCKIKQDNLYWNGITVKLT